MKDKYGNTICKQCKRRITSVVDKDFNPLFKFHSSKIDDELCYHCVGKGDECRCVVAVKR